LYNHLPLNIATQPDDTTCGPTCLHAVYDYYGDNAALADIIDQTHTLPQGGTLAPYLACHALRRGYRAIIYTYDLKTFDPSWFADEVDIAERLQKQARHKHGKKLQLATHSYLEYLSLGGTLRYEDMTPSLIRKYLKRGSPILTGLSATYLYRTPREYGPNDVYDDIRGYPSGHFVVIHGYDPETRQVLIADPSRPGTVPETGIYWASIDRLVGAVMLGILTYDANLLIIEPGYKRKQ